jgi:hypothetical protein
MENLDCIPRRKGWRPENEFHFQDRSGILTLLARLFA